MTRSAESAPLRVAFATDVPGHAEAEGIRRWLAEAPRIEAIGLPLRDAPGAVADVVWVHGVGLVPAETLGRGGPDLLLRGGVLLTGGAAGLPAAVGLEPSPPNEAGRVAWPSTPDDDALPPLRGHASFRGHPLFAGLGAAATTWAPAAGEEHTRVAYVRPSWPSRGRVIAVERSRARIDAGRATIWEYDGAEGRTLCIGAFLPLHGADGALRAATRILARNALGRAAAAPDPGRAGPGGEWRLADAAAVEDPTLAFPGLPLLEDTLGPLEFRLGRTTAATDDAPFHVAGRRAFAAGGAARGLDEVWAHPIRLAAGLRLRGGTGEEIATTPVGVERRVRVGAASVVERMVVPRDAPACVLEWLSPSGPVEVEVAWSCDLRLAGPYPAGALGALRWRRNARGVVVAAAGEDRAVFAFSASPESLDVEDASREGRPLVRVRARVRLAPDAPLRLAVAGGSGDAAVQRALAAAGRTGGLARARKGHAERLRTGLLSLDAPDPAAVQEIEWCKHGLDALLAESPPAGRSLLTAYGSSPAAPADDAPHAAVRFAGAAGARGALACLAAGDDRAARDVLAFLGRHQDPAGRVPNECSTSGVTRYDDPDALPLYLLAAARYLAWTGDLPFLRGEWPRVLRAYAAVRGQTSRGDPAQCSLVAGAVAELAEAAESIGDRDTSLELRGAAERMGGAPWAVETGPGPAVVTLAHRVLGAQPDAPRGRLVLRPEPPPAWGRFTVAGLSLGGAAVTVAYRRRGARHAFRMTQERGAAPLRVILEPALPGSQLLGATVDGVSAELDPRPRGDKLVVPVQVVLDHTREVVMEMNESPGTERRRG
ncbi:MAG TPA: hypothetical protein VMM12_04930 [Longimicrobiales bacterium]|nr:hypothetical protein [Longimicrobiales bacterium]